MRKIFSIIIFIFIMIILTGCTKNKINNKESHITYYQYFDTIITLRVWDTTTYDTNSDLWNGAETIIKDIQKTFQRTLSDEPSELYKLNQSAGTNTPYKVSDDLFYLLKESIDIAKQTEGRFDPTIGALVDLWDIKAVDYTENGVPEKRRPSDEEIFEKLALVDYNLIQLNEEDKTVLIPKQGMIIDLGAIVKGYAADKLKEYLEDQGIKHAILDVGGNIYALGNRYEKNIDGNNLWKIGIRKPYENKELGNVSVKDKTIVTSGIYERYFRDPIEEKTYHHILDTTTGFPVENDLLSVTIITESSTLADALSTSTFAMGLERGKEFIENLEDVEAVFVYYDNNGNMAIEKTSGIESLYYFSES